MRLMLWSSLLVLAPVLTLPDFEGIWLPEEMMGRPPVGALPGGLPGGPPGAPPGAGAPGAPGGAPPGDAPNQTLAVNCAPMQRLSGGGGGDSDLIVQSPAEIVLLAEEYMDVARKIYLDGIHPPHPKPQPNGHSIGHWEGDALIVDTVAFADANGNDRGQHLVERWTRSGNTLTSEAELTDASGHSEHRSFRWILQEGLQYNESVCEEGFDRFRIVDGKVVDPNLPPARATDAVK